MKVSTILFGMALTLSTAAFAGPGQIGSAGNSGAFDLIVPQELQQADRGHEGYALDKVQALFNEAARLSTIDSKIVNITRLTEISAELKLAARSHINLNNTEVVQKIQYVNSKVNVMEIRARLQQR